MKPKGWRDFPQAAFGQPNLEFSQIYPEYAFVLGESFPGYLIYTDEHLLYCPGPGQVLGIDAWSEFERHRAHFKNHALSKDPLARALGQRTGHKNLPVVDLTAGLGGDALLIAAMGWEVEAWEIHPLLFILLDHAVKKAKREHESFTAELTIHFGSSLGANLEGKIAFADPMFDQEQGKKNKAAPHLGMQILRALTQNHPFPLESHWERLVVKRQRLAPPLLPNVDFHYEGKSTRYDVYLKR